MPSGNYARKDIQMFCGECGASYRGIKNWNCKLSEEEVLTIRDSIKNKVIWKHL